MTDPPGRGHSRGTGLALPDAKSDLDAERRSRFEEIFRTHFDFVWSALRGLGVAPAALDDAVQDVFLVVHRRLSEFEGRSAVKTWVFGIALRVAHDHRRKASRLREEGQIPETVADARPSPLDDAARAEATQVLAGFLERLDEDKRDVLVLADLQQLSAPEIAEIVGANVNTVSSRLRAARLQLNEMVNAFQRGLP